MANPSKDKGTRWENSVAQYFRDAGFTECFRMATAGENDAGDLGGIPDFAFECRDRAKLSLAENVSDANNRALNKGCDFGVAVMKKRNAPTASGYVVCDLETFTRLLQSFYVGR